MQTLNEMTMILSERRRQIESEGWTLEHDDEHADGEMLNAAVHYLWSGTERAAPLIDMILKTPDGGYPTVKIPMGWPWQAHWWKPKTRHSNLVRAGALCLAERERLVRANKYYGHVDQKLDIIIREMKSLPPDQTISG